MGKTCMWMLCCTEMAVWNNDFIFWTGTCINNTSVMMFKKGSFEIGGTIYPVAIKVSGNSWLLNFRIGHGFLSEGQEAVSIQLLLKVQWQWGACYGWLLENKWLKLKWSPLAYGACLVGLDGISLFLQEAGRKGNPASPSHCWGEASCSQQT